MGRIRKRYTKEEKLEIVKESLEEHTSLQSLGERYNVHPATIDRWRREYANNKEDAFPGKGNKILTDDQREIERLRKALREKELEAEILKKAMGIFASPNRKNLLS